ncbi:type III secretion system stator protein SctL [Prosthecomicrobium sp. N25]|uniref:type III secretion system stator protein SctL n=1 Tax=Prosthecomicrobium sp. N25 TaxID=3129254 RepID=UPI0030773C3C
MVGYYRLNALGFALPAGTHVLGPAETGALNGAADLVAAAEAEAARIVEAARAAYEEEKARGRADGLAEAQLAAVDRLVEESRVLDEGLAAVERGLADLVVYCVRRLVDGFSANEQAEAVVRAALKQMRRAARAQVRVAPAQYAPVKAAVERMMANFPEMELIDVVEDAALDPPRVIVESAIGRVDGDLGARLHDMVAILTRARAVDAEEGAGP